MCKGEVEKNARAASLSLRAIGKTKKARARQGKAGRTTHPTQPAVHACMHLFIA
jgi:hypothetical protein